MNGKKFDLSKACYIGKAASKGGLKQRLKQLDDTLNGRSGHSGGESIKRAIDDYKNWQKKKWISVSVMSIKCEGDKKKCSPSDLVKLGNVSFLEYKLIADFKKKTGKEPKYNTQ